MDDYQTTAYTEEALYRLVEVYYSLGLTKEAEKYAKLLGYNYQSSNWYKASFKVFNEDYEFNEKKFELEKKQNKKSVFKRFVGKFSKIFN